MLALVGCNASLLPSASNTVPTQVVIPTLSSSNGSPQTEAEVPRVSVEDAKAAFDNGTAIFMDVRSKDAYAVSHVPGAINVQLVDIESNTMGLNLDKNQWIITYCS